MTGFIDIYAKLIIAVVSFIAPLMVYLLNVYSDGIVMVRKNATEELRQFKAILSSQLIDSEQLTTKLIRKSTSTLKRAESDSERKINLLTPKRQINRIFSSLFAALFFVMLYMLSKDESIVTYKHYLSVILLSLSLVCFLCGILILRQVAWISIETKEEIGKRAKEKELQAEQVVSPLASGEF